MNTNNLSGLGENNPAASTAGYFIYAYKAFVAMFSNSVFISMIVWYFV
jgi:hypothetical protein